MRRTRSANRRSRSARTTSTRCSGSSRTCEQAQLRKFGFRFFFSEGRRDIDQVTEIGASRYLVGAELPDRPRHLRELPGRGSRAARRALRRRCARVRDVELAEAPQQPHRAHLVAAAASRAPSPRAGWSTPAAAPACSSASSAWPRRTRTTPTRSGSASASASRSTTGATTRPGARAATPQARWLSTNHLVGAGYWVWLIPLASGSHSVGIVADPALHPLETMNTFDKAMAWLARFQPRLFDALDGKRHLLQDFAFFRNFSYGCKQVFSAQRWALTGEAGLFLDPFYSPGSDFIAIANTYICDLIARDRAGQPLRSARPALRPDLPLVLREHARALPGPVPAVRRPRGAAGQGDLGLHLLLGRAGAVLLPAPPAPTWRCSARCATSCAHCQALNVAVQALLRAWSAREPSKRNPAVMLDQASLPWFAAAQRAA